MHSGDTGFETWPRYLTVIVSLITNDDEVCIKTECTTGITSHKSWASHNCKTGGTRSTKSFLRLGASLQRCFKTNSFPSGSSIYIPNKMCHVSSSIFTGLTSIKPFPIQFFSHPQTLHLFFILGGKEVGWLLVIILQF
jgi:hypothetical protein